MPNHTDWYTSGREPVPHRFEEADKDEAERAIKLYLKKMFGFDPPADWFSENEFKHLYEDLEHLVGTDSTAHTDGSRNLTLGNLVILLTAACGREYAEGWIENISWSKTNKKQVILPSQTQNQALATVDALVERDEGFFHCIKKHDENGNSIIDNVSLTGGGLQIFLDFDYTEQTNNDRPSLRKKLRKMPSVDNVGGDTYTAFRNFWEASGVNEDGDVERRYVTNWFSDDEQTILQIVPL